jgi:hypothetical protein
VWGIKELKEKFIILVTLLSQIPLVFSLVIAEPLNSRCYMQSYIMFALFIVEIISYCMNRMKLQLITENKKRKIYKYSGYAILIFIVLSMTKNISACIFLNNAEMEKHQYIEKMLENKKETITVPYLPFSNLYTVNINPIDENWQINFNNYYNYPQATRYEYISYNEWKDTVYKK